MERYLFAKGAIMKTTIVRYTLIAALAISAAVSPQALAQTASGPPTVSGTWTMQWDQPIYQPNQWGVPPATIRCQGPVDLVQSRDTVPPEPQQPSDLKIYPVTGKYSGPPYVQSTLLTPLYELPAAAAAVPNPNSLCSSPTGPSAFEGRVVYGVGGHGVITLLQLVPSGGAWLSGLFVVGAIPAFYIIVGRWSDFAGNGGVWALNCTGGACLPSK
jgi:hypothetical protein